jgi:membrane protease YdiL (CAAX protease family)
MKTKGVLAYLLLAFGLAWSTIFVARLLLLGLSLGNSLVQIPIAFSPAIAAVIVRRWITREGFADAGLALHLRSGWAYYLVAWLFPLIAVGVVIGLATVLGISSPDLSPLGTILPGVQLPGWAGLALLMGLPILTMLLFWGEEFGWRGYLQIRLLNHSPLKAAIATGFIWAVWHDPLYFLGYSEYAPSSDSSPLPCLRSFSPASCNDPSRRRVNRRLRDWPSDLPAQTNDASLNPKQPHCFASSSRSASFAEFWTATRIWPAAGRRRRSSSAGPRSRRS